MRQRQLIFSLLVSTCCLSQSAFADDSLAAAESSGKKQFQTYCSSCHGMDARGSGPAASVLRVPPPNLRKIASRRDGKFPAEEINAVIDGRSGVKAHGNREMPIWGRAFSDSVGGGSLGEEIVRGELFVLVEYLRSIQE